MKKTVCVQGLGFVGFAMAIAVASAKNKEDNTPLYDVIGIDLDNDYGRKKISDINTGNFPIACNDNQLKLAYKNSLQQGNFKASVDSEDFKLADIVIIDINLDVEIHDVSSKVDFSNLKKAIKIVGSQIKKDTLVIVETTVPPGTTENIIYPILEEELNKRFGLDCSPNLAHSYERVMPGPNYLSSIINFWRVFAGINQQSSKKCREFLSTIINIKDYRMTELSSTTASELSKVLENSYRATNIAFIHEWTVFSENIGVNLFEIIEAIKQRPTHSNINRPGLGVGGYCLTKDPLMGYVSYNQIFDKSSSDFPLTSKAIEINQNMPKHTLNIILKSIKKEFNNTRILILGITYRDQVGDLRHSASIELAKMLIKMNINVNTHDPMVSSQPSSELGFLEDLPDPKIFDAIIFTVSHIFYKEFNLLEWLSSYEGIIVDSNNVLSEERINNLLSNNISLKVVGRGDI